MTLSTSLAFDGLAGSPGDNPWRSFQPEPASTLYENSVFVKTQRADREEVNEELVVRISLGVNKQEHHTKNLKVQITSEEDPFFLHTLEVGEEDFQNLKVEQSILVDFATFPSELIGLLDSCRDAYDEESPKFRAVLRIDAGQSVFSILEVNQFKHLTHIALQFRPGNDVSIKQYLAARLFEVKAERESLRTNLGSTKEELAVTKLNEEQLSEALADQREANSRVVGDMRNSQAALLNDAKKKALEELEETSQRYESERLASENRHKDHATALEQRNAELDLQVRTLMDQKYTLDSKVSELSAKLGTANGELSAAKEELERLRKDNLRMDSDVHERDKGLTQHQIELSGLKQQVTDKDELLKTLRQQLEAAEKHKAALEQSWQETRSASNRAEERVTAVSSEVKKGNQIIERLQSELRSAKAKSKLKAAVIAQQENLSNERQSTVDKLTRELGSKRLDADSLQEENVNLKTRVEDQKKKLEESQALLQSNQQMIQWLNQQVNEAQLGTMGSGSRYSFRPSINPLPLQARSAAGTPTVGGPTPSSSSRPFTAPEASRIGQIPTSVGAKSTGYSSYRSDASTVPLTSSKESNLEPVSYRVKGPHTGTYSAVPSKYGSGENSSNGMNRIGSMSDTLKV
ncbi:hypothetical protein CYMTET_27296 [Cymbomonas tetramitiformis]|uniref:Spindle assembly abnormal protein 6 N-terminal domain-containing protein n=1 Tax=Cymbomonas tetramitiformis TaxID=36881 RepID=A0AAE0BM96_9CHLO|nr:hypothetical protein CYMTET_51764 [Cymbomonas tetramitiformis]KAK3263932.1 hypothetical protein CYMTET_27296 [Cymbomonas tetramitiformis]